MAKIQTKEELKQENNEMRESLAKMEKMMKSLMDNKQIPIETGSINVNMKKKIKVISLFNGILNLTTESGGRGKVYSFKKFGESKPIPNEDLSMIINANYRFFTEGFVYITDEETISDNGLTEYYEHNIINKDKINSILDCDKDELDNIFQKISKIQKEIICNLIIEKIVASEDINMTSIAIISNLTGVNIYEKAQESIKYNDIIDGNTK